MLWKFGHIDNEGGIMSIFSLMRNAGQGSRENLKQTYKDLGQILFQICQTLEEWN
jgi:hypothetical protein